MPNFFYTAKSSDGQTKIGNLYAEDLASLAQTLRGEKLFLIEAVLTDQKDGVKAKFALPSFGVSSVEKIIMTRNLWVMFSAGLSLVKIFDILSSQTKKQKLKSIMLDIRERINKGESLSDSLARHPAVFNNFYRSMVKIGEESGTLEEVFGILSSHMDREHQLKAKIKGAMIYPCIILVVMGCIGVVVSTFVIPKFSSFLLSMNIELPIYTRILIGSGNFSQKYWYLIPLFPLTLVYGFLVAIRTKTGKWAFDTFLIKMPLISSFIKKNNSVILIRSLGSLNQSGISLVRSLEITSETVGNTYFKIALREALEKVKKGEKLSSALKPYARIFPFGALDMIEVGEETGKTSDILKKLSEFYEQEVEEELKNFSAIIEPALLIVIGLAVAFFAISIIEPMYSSLKSI